MVTTAEVGQALVRVLRAGQDIHRCAAAQALGGIGYAGAVDALVERLQDEDEDVRVDAAEALGRMDARSAGEALLTSLVEDPCGDVKLAAVVALGRLKDASAVPVLRGLVRSRDETVVWDEADFLSEGWDDWLDLQLKAIEALGDMGVSEAAQDIIASLDDEMGQDLSGTAFRALAKLGQPGVVALAAYLDAKDGRLRRRAAEALRESGTSEACEVLAAALGNDSAEVRVAAVRALAARDARDPRLASSLEDGDAAVRATATGLCARSWPERLDSLLDDPSNEVQALAVKIFCSDRPPPGPANLAFRLRVKMRGPSEAVAAAACQAFAKLAPGDALADLSEQLQDQGCPSLVRCAAAAALQQLGSGSAAEALGEALADDDREVRIYCMAALARIAAAGSGAKGAKKLLLGALKGELVRPPESIGESEGVKSETASPEALEQVAQVTTASSQVADPVAWPTSTLAAITGAEPGSGESPIAATTVELNETDLEFLALTGGKARRKHVPLNPPLVLHEDVRRAAAGVLGDIPARDVAEALGAALDEEDLELRRRTADSLARLGERLALPATVRDALLAIVGDADRDVRLAVTRALGGTDRTAATVLRERLGDPDCYVRGEAAKALAVLGELGDEVVPLLSDDYPGVRLAGAQALARRGGADAVVRLVEFAFAYDGMHRREIAALLGGLDRSKAATEILTILGDVEQQRKWRIAIDALKELFGPDGDPSVRLVA